MNEAWLKIKAGMYYCIIAIISLVALFFLPALGSTVGLGLALPTTAAGWIVWVATKVIIAVINVLIFHCFILQGKLNIVKDPNYLEAQKILNALKIEKDKVPLSPRQWATQQYGTKGVSIFISSALSVIALTQAVLTFDWIAMLTYLFTILMGLIFGILQMKKTEEYWTIEYLEYAHYIENQQKSTEETNTCSNPITESNSETSMSKS